MSTLEYTKNGNVTILSGSLTFDFSEMMNELGENPHDMFGDLNKLIPELGEPLDDKKILELFQKGITIEYFNENEIWCYLCIQPETMKNYMFSPIDSENRDNQCYRLRSGVVKFKEAGFNIYIVSM
jgi:hypothetical protein